MQISGWRFKHSLCKNASVFVVLEVQEPFLDRNLVCLNQKRLQVISINLPQLEACRIADCKILYITIIECHVHLDRQQTAYNAAISS